MWWIVGIFLVALAAALLFPKLPAAPPPGEQEVEAPVAKVGGEIPVLFGTRDFNDANTVWYGDVRLVAIKSSGGKK